MTPNQRYYLHRAIRSYGDRVTVQAHQRKVFVDADLANAMPDNLHTWLKRLNGAGYNIQQRIPAEKQQLLHLKVN